MKADLTIKEVFSQLEREGLIDPIEEGDFELAPEDANGRGSSLPWYVKLFVGISAWIAAILIVAFFFIIGIIDEEVALFWGLAFCALAIGVNRLGRGVIFWGQLSLAVSLTGQILAIIGFFELFGYYELFAIVVCTTVLEVLLIWLHRDAVLRFISTLVIVSLILALILEDYPPAFLHLLILVLAAGSLSVHLPEFRLKLHALDDILSPVGHALTVSLLGILVMPLTDEFELKWHVTVVGLFVLLMFLLGRIVLDLGYPLYNRVTIALVIGCLLLLIPSMRMPGILAALLVLITGFWRSHRGLLGIASVFLAFYIWAYYYSLEWTLLTKSLVLLASGIIMLALRYFVVRFAAKTGETA
jgi:uncharacterized membrane protein